MPIKTRYSTRDELKSVPLPQHGDSYTTISHGFIIDEVNKELTKRGFDITNETYRSNNNGNVVSAMYELTSDGQSPDMGMMFAWLNSYDKSKKFGCAIGAYVLVCNNGMISGDVDQYNRKHAGTAEEAVIEHISSQMDKAREYYDKLVEAQGRLKKVIWSAKTQSEIIGRLYIERDLIGANQLSVIKKEIYKPSHYYNAPIDSAWALYNHVTLALKDTAPAYWFEAHKGVHSFFMDEIVEKPVVVPKKATVLFS